MSGAFRRRAKKEAVCPKPNFIVTRASPYVDSCIQWLDIRVRDERDEYEFAFTNTEVKQ